MGLNKYRFDKFLLLKLYAIKRHWKIKTRKKNQWLKLSVLDLYFRFIFPLYLIILYRFINKDESRFELQNKCSDSKTLFTIKKYILIDQWINLRY